MIKYGIWHDEQEGDYSIVRWDDALFSNDPFFIGGEIVQTGIRTRAKAEAALRVWQEREAGKRVQQY